MEAGTRVLQDGRTELPSDVVRRIARRAERFEPEDRDFAGGPPGGPPGDGARGGGAGGPSGGRGGGS